MHAVKEIGTTFLVMSLPSIGLFGFSKSNNSKPTLMGKDMYKSLSQLSLNISLSSYLASKFSASFSW